MNKKHRIDWSTGYCIKCGLNHELALDGKECVSGIIGLLMDKLIPAEPWPNPPSSTP